MLGREIVTFVWPNTSAFTTECQSVGAQYYQTPSLKVRSIAYVWKGQYEPEVTRYKLDSGQRIKSGFWMENDEYPSVIDFTERGQQDGPYRHTPHHGISFKVDTLSADVLVSYKMTPSEELRKSPSEQGMVKYELDVSDRRDGKKLARLQYVFDAKKRRACGVTEKDKMDERQFVLKAIGSEYY